MIEETGGKCIQVLI